MPRFSPGQPRTNSKPECCGCYKRKKKKEKNHMKLKTGFSVWSVIPWLIVVLVFYFVRTNKPFFWHHSDMCPLFRSFHWFLFFGVRCVGRVTLTQLSCHGDILNQMWCRFFNNLSCSTYQRITEKRIHNFRWLSCWMLSCPDHKHNTTKARSFSPLVPYSH